MTNTDATKPSPPLATIAAGLSLALGVAAAPLLGLLASAVEASLLILAGAMVLRSRRVELATVPSRQRSTVGSRQG